MINFIKNGNKMLFISSFLIILSVFIITIKGFNFSIDFEGGTSSEIHFDKAVNTDDIKNIINKDFKEVSVIHYGALNKVIIQTPVLKEYDDTSNYIINKIKSIYPKAELVQVSFIGPKVGEELKSNGIIALSIVFISILIYVSFSFEFKYALSSVLALCHDLLITAGFISLFSINIDLTVLAAMLAILGYSLNDTIVVYDRIRENISNNNFDKFDIKSIINSSINETLSRTIMTSLTTSVSLVALLFLGGESLSDFSLVLLFGIFIGTYSSIYIASLLLIIFKLGENEKTKEHVDTENGVI